MKKVNVKSLTVGDVSVFEPSIPFRMSWPNKGTTRQIDEDVLQQLMYMPGFEYMINNGILYIEDMEVKKDLGIEPEDASEPVNVIVLTDKERRRYMVNLSIEEFKKKVGELGYEQVKLLADYAIENKLVDYDKCKVLKEICGRDVIEAIKLSELNKE